MAPTAALVVTREELFALIKYHTDEEHSSVDRRDYTEAEDHKKRLAELRKLVGE